VVVQVTAARYDEGVVNKDVKVDVNAERKAWRTFVDVCDARLSLCCVHHNITVGAVNADYGIWFAGSCNDVNVSVNVKGNVLRWRNDYVVHDVDKGQVGRNNLWCYKSDKVNNVWVN